MLKQKILIVDDQEVNITLLKHLLADQNIELILAHSGHEALEILEKTYDFDLILMDVRMPVLSGFDTVSILKENPLLREIPVIFITAEFIKTEFVNKGYALGAYDYISKPFDKEVLKNKVNVFLSLQRQKKLNSDQAEALTRSNRSMKILNECNTILLYSENESTILNSFCNILVELGNYPFVWIGKIINMKSNI